MNKKRVWLAAILIPVLYLVATHSYFTAYLQVPNRHLLPWDPAIHAKDGILFYLQAKRFDLISFLYTLINLSFWMPLHPILLSITSIFFPFQYDAYVYVNFLSLAAGLTWFFFLIFKSKTFNALQKTFVTLGMLYFLFRIGNSPEFWKTHLSIMIESLAIGLTVVFALSSILEDVESDRLYTRSAIISLSLLLFTKVQYGLFYGIAYFAKHLYLERSALFGRGKFFHEIFKELLQKKIFLGFLLILNLFGFFAVITQNRFKHLGFGVPDGIWAIGFSGLLILTWIVRSRSPSIIHLRQQSSEFSKELTRWILLPFGWYYLLPFRHKIRWLLYNANTQSTETLSQKLSILFSDLGAYFRTSFEGAVLIVALSLALSAWIFIRMKRYRTAVIYSWGLCVLFYLPMSLFAAARDPRFSVTWVVLFPVFILIWMSLIVRKKATLITLCFALIVGGIYERINFKNIEVSTFLRDHNFLSEEHQSIANALKEFDFSKPGIIYGLGNTMDLATILFDLEILKTHPEYSSVFSKREDRELVSNDFGRKGNQNPKQTILDRAANPKTQQIMLFASGFSIDDLRQLSEQLTSSFHFQVASQNRHFVLLKRE